MAADLELTEVEGGTRLRLRVKAGASANRIVGAHGGALKLGVTAPPEKGKANKAVLQLLGETLRLAPSSIELLSGHTSQDKIVRIPLPPSTITARLRE